MGFPHRPGSVHHCFHSRSIVVSAEGGLAKSPHSPSAGAALCGMLVLCVLFAAAAPPAMAQAGAEVPPTLAAAESGERDRAVRMARDGRYDEALDILWRLHRATPAHLPLRADLVAVLSWAGRDDEALELGGRLPFRELEPFVAEAVARSARNVGWPGFAATLYGDVLTRAEDRIESHIGFALSLLEWGELERAEARVPLLVDRFPDSPEASVAAGHILVAANRPVEAAELYRRAQEISGGHEEARQREVMTLLDAGAVYLAVQRMEEERELFEGQKRARLLAARVSRTVSWIPASPASPDPAERFVAADRAIAQADSALAQVGPEMGFPHYQLRFDRIVALRERWRMEEAWEDVRALEAAGVELPPYVHRAGGDAALYLREAKEAVRHYRIALDGWPAHPETRIGLFHALAQLDRHEEAQEVLAEFLVDQPMLRSADGLRDPLPNPDRLEAGIASLLGRAFAGDLAAADAAFSELEGLAPMNMDIRRELASVHLWRGWPRRSAEGFERILALEPDHVGARVGKVSALLELDDLGAARSTLDTLLMMAPENEHVRRLVPRVRAEGLWILSVNGGSGQSTGGDLGTRDHSVTTRLTTPPIADRVRLFASNRRREATYPAGRGMYDRVGLGAELRSRPVRLSVEATGRTDGLEEPGGAARIELRPTDRWSIDVAGDSRSEHIPLQAAMAEIHGWRVSLGVSRRPHESRSWYGEANLLEMSDGNRRIGLHASVEQTLVRRPRGRVAALVEGYGGHNSLDDAPYYNPSRVASPSLSLLWDWTLWRSLERAMVQAVRVGGGAVFQEAFDTEPTVSVRYEHRWDLGPRFQFTYGLGWGRPIYDGDAERRTSVHSALTWRLP